MSLRIGDRSSITLRLDVVNCPDDMIVNRAEASGGVNNGDDWITDSSSWVVKL
jgi:hypothetical protein